MASIKHETDAWVREVSNAIQAIKKDVVGSNVHLDKCERSITAANATDLATSLALAKDIAALLYFHFGDTLAHLAADTTNVPGTTLAATQAAIVDLASAITFANATKTQYNAHRSQSGVHANNDAGNATTSTDATDQSSLNTLLNELKTDMNAHTQTGLTAPSWRVVPV